MTAIVAAICAVLVLAVVLIRRGRERAALERHCITPEDLHTLLGSNQNVALFDVRLPLDLLGNSVVIPSATWISPEDIIANPSLIPADRDAVVYCTCPGDETSRAVLRRALALGFQRIRFLRGGIEGWQSLGYPVEPYEKPFHLNTGKNGAAVAR